MPAARLLAAALVLPLLLAACQDGVRSWPVRVSPSYRPQTFHAFAGGRDMPVAIHGNPFALDKAVWERTVTQAMQGRHWGPETNFTPTPDPAAAARYGLHVVIAFDGAFVQNPTAMCGGSVVPQGGGAPAPRPGLLVQAVYCIGGSDQTFYEGQIEGLTGPADPRLAEFIGRMTYQLFPPRNPDCDDSEVVEGSGGLRRRIGRC